MRISDWSSDVCSSDLAGGFSPEFDALAQSGVEDIYSRFIGLVAHARKMTPERVDQIAQGRVWDGGTARQLGRSEERREGKEGVSTCRSRWSPYHQKNTKEKYEQSDNKTQQTPK